MVQPRTDRWPSSTNTPRRSAAPTTVAAAAWAARIARPTAASIDVNPRPSATATPASADQHAQPLDEPTRQRLDLRHYTDPAG